MAFLVKKFLKSKAGKVTLLILVAAVVFIIMYVYILFNNFLCTVSFGVLGDACKDEKVLEQSPITNSDIVALGEKMKNLRADVNRSVNVPGEDYKNIDVINFDPKAADQKKQINEAEVHIRALMQADLFALEGNHITEETLEKGVLKDNKYVKVWQGTKVEKVWNMAKQIRELIMNSNTAPEYTEVKQRAQKYNWQAADWILFTQHISYQCYLVGDDGGFFNNLFGIGDRPCAFLNKLNGGQYIRDEDTATVKHQHKLTEETWQCVYVPPPTPKPSSSPSSSSSSSSSSTKATKGGPNVAAFLGGVLSAFNPINVVHAHHLDMYIPRGPAPDCGKDHRAEIGPTKTTTYVTYQHLPDILFGFERYSLFETGKTVSQTDGTYRELISGILAELYQLNYGMGDLNFNVGASFIVPMEAGTYNWGGKNSVMDFMTAVRPDHMGIDMGVAGNDAIGTPIYASASGVVISAADMGASAYGGAVMIDHGNGYYTFYAHMLKENIVVKVGQQVAQGQLIGAVGNYGADIGSVPAHLHFEVCKQKVAFQGGKYFGCGKHVDPQDDDNTKDHMQDDAVMVFENNQNKAKTLQMVDKFKTDWRQKALNGQIIYMPGFTPPSGTEKDGTFLGAFVKEFESGSLGSSSIGWDSNGGFSYGTYQISTYKGRMKGFEDYLKKSFPVYYNALIPFNPGDTPQNVDPATKAFQDRWKTLALTDPNGFHQAEHDFIKGSHYEEARLGLIKKIGFDIDKKGRIIREAFWSTAVQHGPGGDTSLLGAVPIFAEALGNNPATISDYDLLSNIYQIRRRVHPSTADRYYREEAKLKTLLQVYPT